MNLLSNLKSVLIIDDSKEEVHDLELILHDECIYNKYCSPDKIDDLKNIKNHQLIFMDFSLDDSKQPIDNIGKIRSILKKICKSDFGSYGLVLWTKHIEYLELFKVKISIDAKNKEYTTPLFIIGLDKCPYLKNGYKNLWDDLGKKLYEDKASLFFLNWRNSVELGVDKALSSIYQLVPDYEKQKEQFPYLLYQVARNHSGVSIKDSDVYDGMHLDAYRAFDELLYSDLISKQSDFENIFSEKIVKPDYSFEDELEQMSKINAKLLFDFSQKNQSMVLPGNVYQLVENNSFLKLKGQPKKHNCIPIAIEMTPPCDSAHKKISSRLVGGFMMDCPNNKEKINEYIDKTFKADSKYLIWPINYNENMKFICLDFRHIYVENDEKLKDISMYKLLFTVKHRLFADILQKFSSHSARLGLSIVQPIIKN